MMSREMTTREDTHGCDYFTSLFLLPRLCNSTLERMGESTRIYVCGNGSGVSEEVVNISEEWVAIFNNLH